MFDHLLSFRCLVGLLSPLTYEICFFRIFTYMQEFETRWAAEFIFYDEWKIDMIIHVKHLRNDIATI